MTVSAGTNRRWDLATLGDLVADLIVPIPSLPIEAGRHQLAKWMQLEAGGTCNTLIMAQRLGLRTVAIGVMGKDPVGGHVRSVLAEEGVDLTGLSLSPEVRTSPALSSWTTGASMSSSAAWTAARTSRLPIPGQPSFARRAGSS